MSINVNIRAILQLFMLFVSCRAFVDVKFETFHFCCSIIVMNERFFKITDQFKFTAEKTE